ncbi:MAG: (Fe-S)-binding protein [bacterium]
MAKFEYGKYFSPIHPLADTLSEREGRFWHPSPEELNAPHDYVLYLGCNVLRTVNLAESIVAVLEKMGLSFVAAGGMAYCCGIVHHRAGDQSVAEKITASTLGKFNRADPKAVLVYCPSCHFHMDQALSGGFTLDVPYLHVTEFLAERIAEMAMAKPVRRRIALHFHPSAPQQQKDAECTARILKAIPGLELMELPAADEWGLHCTPQQIEQHGADRFDAMVSGMFAKAREMGCDGIATVYHSCYRVLCGYEARFGLEFLNYIELVVEAMDIPPIPPRFKQLKLEGNPEAACERLAPIAEARRVSPRRLEEALNRHFKPQDGKAP